MGLWRNAKKVIYKMDFFFTAEVLRFKEEPEYKTFFGGILSIGIMILLLITFYGKVIDTLNKIIITSRTSITSADDPLPYNISTKPGQPFMLGVQIWHHTLTSQVERYFDVTLEQGYYNTGEKNTSKSVKIPLQKCTMQHWASYPNIQKSFTRLNIDRWLCLPLNRQYEIKGKYASEISQSLEISVSKCTNSSYWTVPCASQTTIDQMFANQTNFFFTAYFINPLINADSLNFLDYYLEDSNYIIFSALSGQECQLTMEDYVIQSDQSIIPFTNIDSKTGGIVTKNCIKNRYTVDQNSPVYGTFFFYKSPISRNIQRNYQKIDEVFSYIGGLFGTIAICLFMVNIYNSYSFEILMGSYLFKPDSQSMSNTLKKYNFLSFICHLLYGIADMLGCHPNWSTTRLYYQCRQQMVKQLDILYLFRRVTILERAIKNIFSDEQMRALYFINNRTLAEAKSDRHKFKWKEDSLVNKISKLKNQNCNSEIALRTQMNNIVNIATEIVNQQKNIPGSINRVVDLCPTSPKNLIEDANIAEAILQQVDLDSSSEGSQGEVQKIYNQIYQLGKKAKKDLLSQKLWDQMSQNVKILIQNQREAILQKQQSVLNKNNNFYQIYDEKHLIELKQIIQKDDGQLNQRGNIHQKQFMKRE